MGVRVWACARGCGWQEAEELDDLKGQRVHAWVLVLAGKRMLEESVFLEPTTGIAYAVEQSPYYGIESLWSAANYWVNMQKDKPPAAMSYDLQNLQKWERVLTDTLASPLDGLEAEEEDPEAAEKAKAAQEAAENKKEVEGEEPKVVMEMAPSWVQKLVLNRDRQEAG